MKEIPFTNVFGQVIHPGDTVVTMADGYGHNVKVRPAIYRGMVGYSPSVEYTGHVYEYDEVSRRNVTKTKAKRSTLPRGRVFLSPMSEEALKQPRR